MAQQNNEKLISLIFNVGRIIKEQVHTSLHFSPVEFEVLKFVYTNNDLTMKGIADHLHIKPPSATSIIDGLVERGELKRVKDKGADRRIIRLEITKKGLEIYQDYCRKMHSRIKKIFTKLNKNDKRILADILGKVLKNNQK